MSAVVFDLDGTLIDSAPDIRAIANAVLPESAEPLTLIETHDFIGNGARIFIRRMIAARGLDAGSEDALLRDYLARYEGAHDHSSAYPGVVQALTALKVWGLRLGVCTNKPVAPANAVLAHFGLDVFFDVVIGGDSLPVTKPDPAPLRAAFAALGDPLIYVGDSEVDRDTALALGVPFALFTGGYRKGPVSDFAGAAVFEDWAELPGLLRPR